MTTAQRILPLASIALSACAVANELPQVRDFDVQITQTSPFATSLLVAPVERGADLPKLSQLSGRKFALYFRGETGCAVDTSRQIFVLGGNRVPAGYMVPTICP
jgi:hypothetical protein